MSQTGVWWSSECFHCTASSTASSSADTGCSEPPQPAPSQMLWSHNARHTKTQLTMTTYKRSSQSDQHLKTNIMICFREIQFFCAHLINMQVQLFQHPPHTFTNTALMWTDLDAAGSAECDFFYYSTHKCSSTLQVRWFSQSCILVSTILQCCLSERPEQETQ